MLIIPMHFVMSRSYSTSSFLFILFFIYGRLRFYVLDRLFLMMVMNSRLVRLLFLKCLMSFVLWVLLLYFESVNRWDV